MQEDLRFEAGVSTLPDLDLNNRYKGFQEL